MENHEKATGSTSSGRAVIYLRSAIYDEGEIARQEEGCQHYLAQRNYSYTASIIDNGCSGIGREARPGLARVLEMCEAGTIEALICFRLDRLSRDPAELLELVARLKHAGIRLETVQEGDVFAHPGILHLLGQLALYLQSACTNTRTSRRRKTHELRNEVFSDPTPLFWSIFLKEVEMIYFQEEIVAIKQGERYDTSFLQ